MKQIYLFILFLLLLSVNTICAQNIKSFCGGDGTAANPYQICTAQDLKDLADLVNAGGNASLGKHYIVINDLDLSGYAAGEGWMPIGNNNDGCHFRGNFNGNGKVINNLTIMRENYQGLFGRTSGATIKNLGIENCTIRGVNNVGGLVGFATGGQITNCYVTGNVSGSEEVGGLLGYGNSSHITDCYAACTVTGELRTGGLVGNYLHATITNCSASGNVNGYYTSGGLMGYLCSAHMIGCSASSNVNGNENVGGLVGDSYTFSMADSYAIGDVSGNLNVGGLAGINNVPLTNCYATGNVTGGSNVGGLVGSNGLGGVLTNCYATGSASGNTSVGGLVGFSDASSISNCYAIGNVAGTDRVGGLVGYCQLNSSISNCYAVGGVSGVLGSVGGLVGLCQFGSSISNSYAFNCNIENVETDVGRITGNNNASPLTNNYAHEQMKLWANGAQITPVPNPNGKDGANVSFQQATIASQFLTPAWLTGAFPPVWIMQPYAPLNFAPETNLPILSAFTPSAFPNAVQSPQIKECSHGCLDLYTTGVSSEGCLELEWKWNPPKPIGTYGFTLYQWNEVIEEWQTASTNYDKTIKVLNVYPNIAESNTLQGWMNDPAIGLGKIIVTPVTITNFNANPDLHLKSGGEYIYDAIMFGSWDNNNALDISIAGEAATRAFLNSGRGVIFGHDAQYYSKPNFSKLSDKTNVISQASYGRRGTSKIKVVNDGFLLKYPHLIPYESILDIPCTHSSYQLACGVVWMNFHSSGSTCYNDPEITTPQGTNNFYLTTWNNAAMIQTGHAQGASTLDERKVIANTLWYVAQFTTDTTAKICSALDITAPDVPTVNRYDCTKIDILSNDNGTPYSFYVKATNTVNYADTCTSNILDAVNKSGLKGFYILEDDNPNSIPESLNPATQFIAATDNQVVTYTATDPTKYVHIQAIDSAGNLSDVLTLEPPDCVEFYANNVHYESLEDTIFCYKTVNFHAEIYGEFESLKWYFKKVEDAEYEECVIEGDPLNWSKDFENGNYDIKMVVSFENGEPVILEAILKIKILWIKIKNVRH